MLMPGVTQLVTLAAVLLGPGHRSLEPIAAPRIIMLHGGSLAAPVYLTNWQENLQLMHTFARFTGLSSGDVDTAGTVQVAMFWGGTNWDVYAQDPARRAELARHLNQAQQGALHLPPRTRAAMIEYYSGNAEPGLRYVGAEGLAILSRAGLPLPGTDDSLLVAGAVNAFHEALRGGDSTAALAWLASDAVVLEAGTRETRQEYRDHHLGADMQYARTARTERGPIRVTVVGDAAWAESTSETTRSVEGRTSRSSGAELMVLSRSDNGWRIRAIHWSSRTRRD